jgi:hypothetical protein
MHAECLTSIRQRLHVFNIPFHPDQNLRKFSCVDISMEDHEEDRQEVLDVHVSHSYLATPHPSLQCYGQKLHASSAALSQIHESASLGV